MDPSKGPTPAQATPVAEPVPAVQAVPVASEASGGARPPEEVAAELEAKEKAAKRRENLFVLAVFPIIILIVVNMKGKGIFATKPLHKPAAGVLDRDTGIEWPARDTNHGRKLLLGAGVRVKKLGPVAVNVYSVGFYVDAKYNALQKALVKDRDSPQLLDNLLQGKFPKLLNLRFVRSVGQQKVVEALTSVSGVKQAALDEFAETLNAALPDGVAKDQVISLLWPTGPTLEVYVDHTAVGKLKMDGKLPPAVFEMFLGRDSVSPALHKSIRANAEEKYNAIVRQNK